MDILSMIIIWCDVSFETEKSYKPMKDEFNETATATPKKPANDIDMKIFNEGKEGLRSMDLPLITVRTCDEAISKIEEHKNKKIFVISSGTVGRCLVPEIASKYPYVHNIYIYAHNIALHVDWAREYTKILKISNFHTTLLLRLTRDIAKHFIERGRMYLKVDQPQDALVCFNHARNLEIEANIKDKMAPNSHSTEPESLQPDFRDHLDLLEGDRGLICQAETAVRAQEHPLQTS